MTRRSARCSAGPLRRHRRPGGAFDRIDAELIAAQTVEHFRISTCRGEPARFQDGLQQQPVHQALNCSPRAPGRAGRIWPRASTTSIRLTTSRQIRYPSGPAQLRTDGGRCPECDPRRLGDGASSKIIRVLAGPSAQTALQRPGRHRGVGVLDGRDSLSATAVVLLPASAATRRTLHGGLPGRSRPGQPRPGPGAQSGRPPLARCYDSATVVV